MVRISHDTSINPIKSPFIADFSQQIIHPVPVNPIRTWNVTSSSPRPGVTLVRPPLEDTTANEPLMTLKGIRERVAKSPKSLPLVCTTKTGLSVSCCTTREEQSKALMPTHSTRTKDKASSRVSANLQADRCQPLALGLHEIATAGTLWPLWTRGAPLLLPYIPIFLREAR